MDMTKFYIVFVGVFNFLGGTLDPVHSKIPHQQVFKEGPKELGFWFLWIQCQKGLESSLCITTLHNLM
jgi:hypothetical protein